LHDGEVRGYITLLLKDLVRERKERTLVLEQLVNEYLRFP
jgi:hypothetical protein